MNLWDNIKKYMCLELIFFIILIAFCIYIYFTYERHKIVLEQDIQFDPIYLITHQPKKRIITKHIPKTKKQPKLNKHEELCRSIFEKLLNKKFPSVRPSFLKNPVTGANLELDGYCEELKIAFEYDGEQHSKYNPHFHRNGPKEFVYQVKKDDYKTKKCKLEGITLIRIPHYVHESELEQYITRQLKKHKKI